MKEIPVHLPCCIRKTGSERRIAVRRYFGRLGNCLVLTLMVSAVAVLAPCVGFAQQKLGAPPGKGSYTRYCAVCHGPNGKGDGPMASLLTTKPGDLTQLAKKNKGTFPALRVARVIDGRDQISAHGPVDMPVWGERFSEAESPSGGSHVSQTAVRARIQLLIRYLYVIQEK